MSFKEFIILFIILFILFSFLFYVFYKYYKKINKNQNRIDIKISSYNVTDTEVQQIIEPGYNDVPVKLPSSKNMITIPDINLTFPFYLPNYKEIVSNEHKDPRMLTLFMKSMFHRTRNSFTDKDINEYYSNDFGSATIIIDILEGKGFIKEKSPKDIMQNLYTLNELKTLCQKKNLSTSGNKTELIERFLNNGYKVDRRKYRHKLYEITNSGQAFINEEEKDYDFAVVNAMNVIKKQNYQDAVNYYNNYDNKWGVVHASGKKHTIFADYDIPHARFEYIANYPMQELQNSEEFKSNLKACLIAGLMCGNKDSDELISRFHMICNEDICCPDILDMYRDDQDEDPATVERILTSMQINIEQNARYYVLKYYISKILYLSNNVLK